ncbi:HNH endonuclease [Candidatus Zixiibacteriota bacterium]
MQQRISGIRARTGYRGDLHDSLIGCVLILAPVFFPREMWFRQPDDWPAPTQSDKRYDLSVGEGLRVWEECKDRAGALNVLSEDARKGVSAEQDRRYGDPILITPRLGQGTFRVAVTESYCWGCAVTNEHSLPALDAAHIRPYAKEGPHAVNNGLLLRADLHRLFDQGYITVTTDLRVEVSKRLREDYQNGHSYYPLHGCNIITPEPVQEKPAAEFLNWHNDNVFRS